VQVTILADRRSGRSNLDKVSRLSAIIADGARHGQTDRRSAMAKLGRFDRLIEHSVAGCCLSVQRVEQMR
jgi:hypothetical protein